MNERELWELEAIRSLIIGLSLGIKYRTMMGTDEIFIYCGALEAIDKNIVDLQRKSKEHNNDN